MFGVLITDDVWQYEAMELQQITRSERKAWFESEVRNLIDSLYGLAYRLCQNQAEAEDIVAESITKPWVALETLEKPERFRAWLFCIMRNHYFSQYRKRANQPSHTSYDEQPSSDGEIANLLIEQPDDFLYWWANPENEVVNQVLC